MASNPHLSPADQVRAWMAAGATIRTSYEGEQNSLFGDSDRMIKVMHGRTELLISEAEFNNIAATYNNAQPIGAVLRGLQSPMQFDSGFWLQGNPESE